MHLVQTWHPSFVGHSTFTTALATLEQNHKETPIGQHLIEHFQKQIQYLEELAHYRPMTTELRNRLKELFGSDKATNKVYSAYNHMIPLQVSKGILQRQDQGKNTAKSSDETVNSAYDITETTKEFYQSIHGINLNTLLGESPDNSLPLVSVVHYGGKGGSNSGYDNAFWTPVPGEMVYGDGHIFKPLVGEPTVGIHEISHMVTQEKGGIQISSDRKPSGIDYESDAGGINEGNSDAGAIAALQRKLNKLPLDADCPWRIGQGLFRDNPSYALRDMTNPGNGYKNDPYLGSDPQAGYTNYHNWADKAKTVDPHLSSATYLNWYYRVATYSDGPTFSTVEKVRMAALPYCKPKVTYPEYKQITIEQAKKLFPESDKIWQAIEKAWNEVGVI